MLHGKAPVALGDIVHALAASPAGMRPVPIKDGESAMRAVPLLVNVNGGPTGIVLHVDEWRMIPHVAANTDPEKGPITVEQMARVVFTVKLPLGFRLVDDVAEAARVYRELHPEEPDSETGVEDGPREIPELANVDPAVFKTDPDRLMALYREVNKKPAPGTVNPDA